MDQNDMDQNNLDQMTKDLCLWNIQDAESCYSTDGGDRRPMYWPEYLPEHHEDQDTPTILKYQDPTTILKNWEEPGPGWFQETVSGIISFRMN